MPLPLALLAVALLTQQPPTVAADCPGGVSGTADLCLADKELVQADALRDRTDRNRRLKTVLDLYRKAASSAADSGTKIKALDGAARALDASHLDDAVGLELTLREMIGIAPNELRFMFRLARLEEDQGRIEAAEDTLLTARRQQPQELDPYKMLAQFYARRATALSRQAAQGTPSPTAADIPGAPDKEGIYQIGGGVESPQRIDIPRYPDEAKAAGITGTVLAEIVVNEQGLVTDARIIRSIPMLDEAALETVKQWRFRPSLVNGKAVPVRMVVNVNFTQ